MAVPVYDSETLEEFAAALHRQGWLAVFSHALAGLAVFGALGWGVLTYIVSVPDFQTALIGAAVLGGVLGAIRGYSAGLVLRAHAQMALGIVISERQVREFLELAQRAAGVEGANVPAAVEPWLAEEEG